MSAGSALAPAPALALLIASLSRLSGIENDGGDARSARSMCAVRICCVDTPGGAGLSAREEKEEAEGEAGDGVSAERDCKCALASQIS